MGKKYFFFDIDGTLTDRSTGQIVPSAAEAVRKLKEAGHFVSIATGRACYKATVCCAAARSSACARATIWSATAGMGSYSVENLGRTVLWTMRKHLPYTGRRWNWDMACMRRWMILIRYMETVSGSMTRRE